MNRPIRRLAVVSTLAALVALAMGSSSASAATIPNCVVAQNIEGIIDDSESMRDNDPENYRADPLEAIAFFNQDKTMGAVVFGSGAINLFGPFPVGPNFAAIRSALGLVASTSGSTNYNAAFTAANARNPSANARIFLSDGAPTVDVPPNPDLWRTPRIPAYVVGFGSADFSILNQIATDTGGPSPLAVTNASQLRAVSQIINARINCQTDPLLVERRFGRQGQTKGVSFTPDGSTAEILISWPTVGNVFRALFGGGKKKGGAASVAKKAKKRKPRVQTQRGESYLALNLSNLRGKVRFKLNTRRLLGAETATVAIIP
jgi:hypothetical protein